MKKGKICSKLKKILITITCVITLVFSMPVKAKAEIIGDFLNLLLKIPDAIMWATNRYIANDDTPTDTYLNFEGWTFKNGKGYIYNFSVTPYEIFSSGSYQNLDDAYYTKLGIFDINFFANKEIKSDTVVSSELLSGAVGMVYKSLRNLCMVLMLLVLLYIGIRIIISSAAESQSKYKQMLVDWLVGFCLLFIMHYIMSFIVNVNYIIVDMLKNDEGDSYYIGLPEIEDGWVNIYSGRFGMDFGDFTDLEKNIIESLGKRTLKLVTGGGKNFWHNFLNTFNFAEVAEDAAIESIKDEVRTRHFYSDKVVVNGNGGEFKLNQEGYIDLNNKDYNLLGYRNSDVDLSEWGDNGEIYVSAYLENTTSAQGDSEEYVNRAIYKANIMEFARTLSSFGLKEPSNIHILHNNSYGEATPSIEEAPSQGEEEGESSTLIGYAYGILYLVLVIETVIFIIQYLKRVFQLAMLTMIAPLIAFMYPIDKIGDEKAQAYNTWIKDYIFNVLLQPLHLLLYTIFIGAANELFHKNLIYALVMYGFMIPAEKYFKKIFGFEKATGVPPGGIAHGIGAGLGMSAFKTLTGLKPPHGPKGGSRGGDKERQKLKIKRDKLQKPDSSNGGTPSPTSSGSAGGKGRLTDLKENKSGDRNNASVKNSNKPKPTASNTPNRGKFGKLLRATGTDARKRFSRAITGGKDEHFKGSNIVGNIARKGAKLGGRAFGTAALGTAGLMVGAATAMATGDINNLAKGVSVGAVAGWNRGGEIADWASNGVSNVISDIDTEWANIDEGHRARYFINEAKESFRKNGVQLNEKQDAMVEKMGNFVDFKGDENLLDTYIEAAKTEFGGNVDISKLTTEQMYKVDSLTKDTLRFGDMDDADNEARLIKAKTREYADTVKTDPASITDAEVKEFLDREKDNYLKDVQANEEEIKRLEREKKLALEGAETDGVKDKIESEYAISLAKVRAKGIEISERKPSDEKSVRQQLAQQKERDKLNKLIATDKEKIMSVNKKAEKIKS